MQLLYVWFSHFWFIFHCWPSFSTLSVNVGLFALHCHSWWLGKIGINYNNTLSRWILFLTVNLVMLVSLNWIHILICRSNRPLLSDPPLLFTRIFSFWLRVGRKLLRHPSTPSPHPSYLASRWILSNSRDLGKMEKKTGKMSPLLQSAPLCRRMSHVQYKSLLYPVIEFLCGLWCDLRSQTSCLQSKLCCSLPGSQPHRQFS